MYIIRGLKSEFDQNVRVLETQREITVNNVWYALKQEEMKRNKRNEEKTSKDECVREKSRNNFACYNCRMKGEHECHNKQKYFNCQGFNHKAADCKEPKRNSSQGRGFKRTSSDRERRRGYGSNEVTLKASDQAVLSVRVTTHVNTILNDRKGNGMHDDFQD